MKSGELGLRWLYVGTVVGSVHLRRNSGKFDFRLCETEGPRDPDSAQLNVSTNPFPLPFYRE